MSSIMGVMGGKPSIWSGSAAKSKISPIAPRLPAMCGICICGGAPKTTSGSFPNRNSCSTLPVRCQGRGGGGVCPTARARRKRCRIISSSRPAPARRRARPKWTLSAHRCLDSSRRYKTCETRKATKSCTTAQKCTFAPPRKSTLGGALCTLCSVCSVFSRTRTRVIYRRICSYSARLFIFFSMRVKIYCTYCTKCTNAHQIRLSAIFKTA